MQLSSPEADDDADARYCSTATLIFGPDQSYDYVDCARNRGKATYFASPTERPSKSALTSSSALETVSDAVTIIPQGHGGEQGGGDTNNVGAIVGGSIGGLALVLGSAVAVVYILRGSFTRPSDTTQKKPPPEESDRRYPDWKDRPIGSVSSELEAGSAQAIWELPAHLAPSAPPVELPTNNPGTRGN